MTRSISALLLLSLAWCTAGAAIPFEQLFYKGKAEPFYTDSTDAEQQKYIQVAKDAHLAERMSTLVNNSLMLKSNIAIGFEPCGSWNAFFSPRRRALVVCSEFLGIIVKTAHNDKDFMMKLPRDQFAKVVNGLLWSVFFHELGHAIISTNGVAITGREEDVADQFAVWYAVNFVDLSQNPIVMPTIWFWRRIAMERDITTMSESERRQFMANEHSLDEQRVFNLACWVLGTGSEGGARTAQFAALPTERAQRCPEEYASVDAGMRSQFKKYFKVKPLRGNW